METPMDKDVKADPASSADPGVKADPPPAIDVTSASSTDKGHEENVPYDRFKELLDKNKELEARVEGVQDPPPVDDEPVDEIEDSFLENLKDQPAQQPQAQADLDAYNTELMRNFQDNPSQTLFAYGNDISQRAIKQYMDNERQARKVRGFDEEAYHEVDDEVVAAAQNNPALIRSFIAKEMAAKKGKKAPETPVTTPPPTDGKPLNAMEAEKEKLMLEGEKRLKARQQAAKSTDGLAAESTSANVAGGDEEHELEETGNNIMKSLGVDPKRGAKRLDKILSRG